MALPLAVSFFALVPLPTLAPTPHPTLADVVTEYRRLELPLLPAGAEVVRIDFVRACGYYEEPETEQFLLAFRVPPDRPGGRPRYLEVCVNGPLLSELKDIRPSAIHPTEPTAEALRLVRLPRVDFILAQAVMCEVRGWNGLAVALYDHSREWLGLYDPELSVMATVRVLAFYRGVHQLREPTSDRAAIYRQMRDLLAEEPELRTKDNLDLVCRLEVAVAPRTANPGTVDRLVEDLADHWAGPDDLSNTAGKDTYWKLVDMGFAAVPALLEHLDDERPTRAMAAFQGGMPHTLEIRVKHLAGQILTHLLSGEPRAVRHASLGLSEWGRRAAGLGAS